MKGSGRDRPTIAAARGVHKWNTEKRSFVHLIFTELILSHGDVEKLVHACFPDMMQLGYNAEYSNFNDIWNGRNLSSHSKEWVTIARPRPAIQGKRAANLAPYTIPELAEFARIRAVVHQVATANNINIVLSTGPTSRELHDPSGATIAPAPAPMLASAQPGTRRRTTPRSGFNAKVSGKAARTSTSASKRKTSTASTNSRTRRQGAVRRYREESQEESEEESGEDVEDEEAEEEDEKQVWRETDDDDQEQEEDSYYGPPISEPGYDLISIQGPRFRHAKTVQQRKPANAPTALDMVHHGSLTTTELRDGSKIISAPLSQRFGHDAPRTIDEDNADPNAYFYGGAALRVYYQASHNSPAHFADTMICDTTQCVNTACQNVTKPYTYTAMTKSGKPFVHWEDCASDEYGGLEFFPDHVKGPTTVTVNPAYIEKANIVFHNGFEKVLVQALVCSEGECRRCELRAAGLEDEEGVGTGNEERGEAEDIAMKEDQSEGGSVREVMGSIEGYEDEDGLEDSGMELEDD